MNKLCTILLALNFLAFRQSAAATEEICMPNQSQSDDAQHQHCDKHSRPFQNADEFAAKFDDPSRDEWQKPDEIFNLIDLKDTDKLADIGAGTGYFTIRGAKRVPNGLVYAVDAEPEMLSYIHKRAKGLGLNNIKTCQSHHHQVMLPEPVQAILIVNTYHHIDDRSAYFTSLKRWLAPNGQLVIVEGKPGTPMEPPPQLRVAQQQIVTELEQVGYSLCKESTALPYQSLQIFTLKQR
jgi:ubiquinone/menaquinone biosynthesis C-methylase UbiE